MTKLIASVLLLSMISFAAYSQQATVKGKVTDTAEKKNLANSVIALLRASDSTLVKFTRSNKEGDFILPNLRAGSYLVLVTHPTFADYYVPANLKDTSTLDLAQVPMILRSQLLEQVVVSQKLGAIRIKKDTTEYIADSFKVAQNANVEELLKRLPGIQVDADGKIKTQGEEVQKVLVDGEEFFGDDPTMATQNIRADAVEKVQVFDKKSDQAAFTGIDDGQRTKTINLKLKEDKKNGYFGKVTLGGGLKDKFNNSAMINAFKGKRKFAAYGIMSNTGRTGLGWNERNAYGGGDMNMQIDEESGGMFFYSEGDDFGGWSGSYYGEGIPTSWSAGTHYSNKFDGDRHKINLNYRFNKLNTIGSGSTITEYILGDSSYFRDEFGSRYNQRIRNNVSGTYEVQLDSSSSLKLTANGTLSRNTSRTDGTTNTLTGKRALINSLLRTNTSKGESQSLNTTILYRKKFKRIGRTLSFNFDQRYSNSDADGFLKSFNEAYGNDPKKDTTDQQKINNSTRSVFSGKISYTEPLSKTLTLEMNYSLGNNNSESERLTYDEVNGKYEDLVDTLSTHFNVNILTNSGGFNLRYNKKTINFSVGGTVSNAAFRQEDLFQDTVRNYYYLNLFPRASFNWNFKPQSRVNIRYNGSTRQPTIDQLQPLKDNTDNFYQRIGNPNLKQEFRHNFGANFSDFKVLNNRHVYGYLDFTTIQNAISSSDTIDANFKRVSQPFNVTGNYNYSSYISMGFKLKKSDFNINFYANISGSNNNSYITDFNGRRKIQNRANQSELGVGVNYHKDKKLDFNLSTDVGYNVSKSSQVINYWSNTIRGSGTLHLPWKTQISTDINFNIRQKTEAFPDNRNVFLWNATLSKKLFKDETGLLSIEMRDVLNQNLGFSRDINESYIQQRTYETIRRFWMLSFTWNFSKNGKAPTNPWD
jgi:hypothetical protein